MYGINLEGFTKTYDGIIEDVIGRKAKIKYRNRDAKILRESHTISNLSNINGNSRLIEIDKFNKKQMLAAQMANSIQQEAEDNTMPPHEIRAGMAPRYAQDDDDFDEFNRRPRFNGDRPTSLPQALSISGGDSAYESVIDSLNDDISDELFHNDQMEVVKT